MVINEARVLVYHGLLYHGLAYTGRITTKDRSSQCVNYPQQRRHNDYVHHLSKCAKSD